MQAFNLPPPSAPQPADASMKLRSRDEIIAALCAREDIRQRARAVSVKTAAAKWTAELAALRVKARPAPVVPPLPQQSVNVTLPPVPAQTQAEPSKKIFDPTEILARVPVKVPIKMSEEKTILASVPTAPPISIPETTDSSQDRKVKTPSQASLPTEAPEIASETAANPVERPSNAATRLDNMGPKLKPSSVKIRLPTAPTVLASTTLLLSGRSSWGPFIKSSASTSSSPSSPALNVVPSVSRSLGTPAPSAVTTELSESSTASSLSPESTKCSTTPSSAPGESHGTPDSATSLHAESTPISPLSKSSLTQTSPTDETLERDPGLDTSSTVATESEIPSISLINAKTAKDELGNNQGSTKTHSPAVVSEALVSDSKNLEKDQIDTFSASEDSLTGKESHANECEADNTVPEVIRPVLIDIPAHLASLRPKSASTSQQKHRSKRSAVPMSSGGVARPVLIDVSASLTSLGESLNLASHPNAQVLDTSPVPTSSGGVARPSLIDGLARLFRGIATFFAPNQSDGDHTEKK